MDKIKKQRFSVWKIFSSKKGAAEQILDLSKLMINLILVILVAVFMVIVVARFLDTDYKTHNFESKILTKSLIDKQPNGTIKICIVAHIANIVNSGNYLTEGKNVPDAERLLLTITTGLAE